MDFLEYSEKFADKANTAGYSAEVIKRCLSYAKPLLESGLPIIYNPSHLASLTGYNTTYLKRAATHTSYFYRVFRIKKKNEEFRTISEPLPSLKEIQHWLLRELLYNVEASKYSKAYVPNTTIKQNLVFHRRMPLVLKLDITNFFGSIKRSDVTLLFHRLGYSRTLSNLLSKLCCLEDQLPQGAPTSPYLSNLYLKQFDEIVGAYCFDRKIRYTRYADDLTFSGSFDSTEIVDLVSNELKKLKLYLNDAKTTLMKSTDRQVVTGVVVNEKLQLERGKRKDLRQTIYYIKLFGLKNHMERIGVIHDNYLEHLLGKVNFILFLNHEDKEFQGYYSFLKELKAQQ